MFDGDWVRAWSRARGIVAAARLPSPQAFAVPAVELDEFLKRASSVTGLSIEGDNIILKGGRLRSTIQLCADEPQPNPELPSQWTKPRSDLATILKRCLPFIGDRTWLQGVHLGLGKVVVMSGSAGLSVDAPWLDGHRVGLPREGALFLAEQGAPDGIAVDDNFLWARWGDERWARFQLMSDGVPANVDLDAVLDSPWDGEVKVDKELMGAFDDAEALSDGTVFLTAAGFEGRKGVGNTLAECDVAVAADHRSGWRASTLRGVLEVAEAWSPARFPDKTPFRGKGIRGVIVGSR